MKNQIRYIQTKYIICFVSSFLVLQTSCNDDVQTQESLIELTINDAYLEQESTNKTLNFVVKISKVSDQDISFNYEVKEGTAKFNKDIKPEMGIASIPKGSLSTTIDATVLGSDLRQPNIDFKVELSQIKGGKSLDNTAIGMIITENRPQLNTENTGFTSPTSYPGYNLVWSQEFNEEKVNTAIWNYEMGNANGWGNKELEYYTGSPKNVFLSNGRLIIEARKEKIDNFDYTSTRMTTRDKKDFKYGRFDIRAKLPKGKGIWPAIWMLGSNIGTVGWPKCGEIDIMELIGSIPNEIHGTLHWEGLNGGHSNIGDNKYAPAGDFSQEFNVYSIIREKDKITWLLNDVPFYTITKSQINTSYDPFNNYQFLILNVAVGGNWPGSPNETTVFPQRMFVDYIRVFEK